MSALQPCTQGWKLHVSASVSCAEQVLNACLPVLRTTRAAFKAAPNLEALAQINSPANRLQNGKFITVYPDDDVHAVAIARDLTLATAAFYGPIPPGDRRLVPGTVSYRYGGFELAAMRTLTGSLVPAIQAPDGKLVPDRRDRFECPVWTHDPFESAGLVSQHTAISLVADRFLPYQKLSQSETRETWLAAGVQTGEKVVLRFCDAIDTVSAAALETERQTLAALSSFVAPLVIANGTDGTKAYLAFTFIEGETLSAHVQKLNRTGGLLSPDRRQQIQDSLQRQLGRIHDAGFVFGDLKSSNIVLTESGEPHLIDFGHGCMADRPMPQQSGTRGYGIGPLGKSRDIEALDALCLFMATGLEPSLFSDPGKFSSLPTCCSETGPPAKNQLNPCDVVTALSGLLGSLEREVGVCLSSNRPYCSKHPAAGDLPSDDIGMGGGGLLLATRFTASAVGPASQNDPDICRFGHRIAAARSEATVGPGLYAGDSGIAVALLHAGLAANDQELIDAAFERLSSAYSSRNRNPDLYAGIAGLLRATVWFQSVLPSRSLAERIVELADEIEQSAFQTPDGTFWEVPIGPYGIRTAPLIGYAHGAAGIADALLDAYDLSGNHAHLECSKEAARWIRSHAIDCLEGAGLTWPSEPGGSPVPAYWCHGAGGIARYMLRLGRYAPGYLETAKRAAVTVSRASRWFTPTQCHGLAGSLETLLDFAASDPNGPWDEAANGFARLLIGWLIERGDSVVTTSESPDTICPDLLVGYGGVAVALARFKTREPGLLSHAWVPGSS